ncbi:hypothetical protein Q0590_26650 [Rhodocytophaga aerolata]|uniref:Uncharacterized protein n=1 Tax=Rhodocytophaga aerolata TaxID=455078 RepID=A0ABT8RFC6_9BACT|nr:hypothetical protein [Rhodocytophaga aerolata]MDO1449888.1 hypothetical protein [Rhodocytophaga aerolata]
MFVGKEIQVVNTPPLLPMVDLIDLRWWLRIRATDATVTFFLFLDHSLGLH